MSPSPNPLSKNIALARRTSDYLGNVFARLGVGNHPRGVIKTAYRNAKRATTSALAERQVSIAVGEVMRGLRASVRSELASVFANAQAYGTKSAIGQLENYGVTASKQRFDIDMTRKRERAISAVETEIAKQEAAIAALVLTNYQPTQIVGDENRSGVLHPGVVLATSSFWAAALLWNAFAATVNASGVSFKKQVVAALDARTTETCMRAHGQIQPLDKPFNLTGSPRFADQLDWSPFHWYCRTSVVLYDEAFDFGSTDAMIDAAKRLL